MRKDFVSEQGLWTIWILLEKYHKANNNRFIRVLDTCTRLNQRCFKLSPKQPYSGEHALTTWSQHYSSSALRTQPTQQPDDERTVTQAYPTRTRVIKQCTIRQGRNTTEKVDTGVGVRHYTSSGASPSISSFSSANRSSIACSSDSSL